MTAEDQASLEPILRISPTAREKLLEFRAEDPQPERLVLRLEVTGVVDGEYTHNMYFQLRESVTPSDTVLGDDDLAIAMPPDSVEKLRGASVDWVVEFDQAGWAITNPNRPRPTIGSPLPIMPVGPSSPAVGSRPPADLKADLSGAVAQRVNDGPGPADQPEHRGPRGPRRVGGGRGRHGLPPTERRMPGLQHGNRHAWLGDRGCHQGARPGDHEGARRHRPR